MNNNNANQYGNFQENDPVNGSSYPAPSYNSYPPVITEAQIPEEYKPISAWGYIGYNLLFALPLAGFICLCVFSFGGTKNKNLRNYARSYLLVMVIVILIITVLFFTGVFSSIMYEMRN